MAIFYPQVVFWVSCTEAEWLSIMLVWGDFIVERIDVCVSELVAGAVIMLNLQASFS